MRRRAPQAIDVEVPREFERIHPLVRRPVMAEAQQVVADRGSKVSAVSQLADCDAAAPLRLRRSARIQQERQVAVARRFEAECAKQEQLPWRIAQVIVAAQHLCHAHQGVVDRVAEEEHRAAVGTAHDKIAERGGLDRLRSAHEIVEADRTRPGNREPQRGAPAGGGARCARGCIEPAAGAWIARRLTRGELRPARDFELDWRAIAGIGVSLPLELVEEPGVKGTTFRLAVGSPAVVSVGTRVPVDAEPFKIRKLGRDEIIAAALPVRVLDAKDEAPAAAARQQETEERRPRIARMQGARGARRESSDDCGFHRAHSLKYRTRRLTREVG